MEHFVIIVNGWKPLTIIPKSSILDVAAVLDALQTIIHNEIGKSLKDFSSEYYNLKKTWCFYI